MSLAGRGQAAAAAGRRLALLFLLRVEEEDAFMRTNMICVAHN